MRKAILTLSLAFALAAPATAQTYGTPATLPSTLLSPMALSGMASVPCPTVLGGWSICNSVQQWISLYNKLQAEKNQLAEMQANVQRYATYPQALASNVQGDLQRVTALVNQNAGLSFTDQQIQATVARLFPNYAPGASYAAYTGQLSQATRASVLNALQVAGLEVSTTQRDADLASTVKTAVANATSPTQSVQALAQLLAVLIEQVQKEQRLSAGSIQSASAYYLAQTSRKQSIDQAEQTALKQFQATMDVTFAPLTPAQTASLATAASGVR
jgi:P-type conjugative transfer protein TrbJ